MKIKFLFLPIIGLMIAAFSYFFNLEERQDSINQKATPTVNLYDIPLYFEQNQGQTASEVKYLTRCPGHSFYFAPNEVTMVMQGKEKEAALKIQFIEGNSPLVKGLEKQKYETNYFIGNSANWKTAIPSFGKILYQDLYPGINAVFYGNGKQLEYDFCVNPNGDPNNILLRFDGAQKLAINQEGTLNIFMDDNIIAQMKKPFIYQMNQEKKQEIEGQFVLAANDTIRFSLNEYDATKELIIDPVLAYSTYLGGPNTDHANGIAVDSDGNTYIAGYTQSAYFPTTVGAFQKTYKGSEDAFVTKLNSTGTALIYSTYLGGSGLDDAYGIVVDNNKDAYIVGYTQSSNFPTTPEAFQTKLNGTENAFVVKLDSTGRRLIYSTYLGGSSVNQGRHIAIDANGNAYIAGFTESSDFPTIAGSFQTTFNGPREAFVSKLNSNGTKLVYSTYIGETNEDLGYGIQVDTNGDAYITGYTKSSNFPTTPGAFQTSLNGVQAGFITKLNSSGTELIYSTFLSGSDLDGCYNIAIENGEAYVTGAARSSNFPTTAGAFQSSLNGFANVFVTKLNSTGTKLVYSTYLGGSDESGGFSIATRNGEAYVSGYTFSPDFPTTAEAFQTSPSGSLNAFLSKLNSKGTELIYSTYFGGQDTNQSNSLALDNNGNAYITGSTTSTDFPTTAKAFQKSLKGVRNAFIANFKFYFNTKASYIQFQVNPNPVKEGKTVSLTAMVYPSEATGSVTFFNGDQWLGTKELSNGKAIFTTNTLTPGIHFLTASYGGNDTYQGTLSQTVKLEVLKRKKR